MENSDRSTRVRKYRKSSVPRLRWTSDLHDHFVEAVKKLGGKYKATPKRIMQMMAVRGLKISHIKSHLQMYRNVKNTVDSNRFVTIKNYQEKESGHKTLVPLGQVSQAPTHRMQGRSWKFFQVGENLSDHEYQVQGRKESRDSIDMARIGEGEIPWTNIMELAAPQSNQINSTPQSCRHCPINLDLTMSSHCFH